MMKKRILQVLAMALALVLLMTSLGLAETLRYPDRGAAVVRLQQALTQTGHYKGLIDGQYGTGTRAAVEAFQKEFGLTVDGVAGSATQYQLKLLTGIDISADDSSDSGSSGSGSTGSTLPGSATGLFKGDYTKLIFGSQGDRVRVLQRALMALGFDEITVVDGDYGTSTYKAVKEFQQTVGLTVDGKAGPNTLKKLETYFDENGNAISGPIVTNPPAADDENLKYDVPTRTLRIGMSGLDVQYTQERLKALGYYTGTSDGKFGTGMYAAVKAFQTKNGITVDGVIGKNTRTVLFSEGAIGANEVVVNPETHRTLRLGMKGDDVTALQIRLKALGYYTMAIDGQYGKGTVAAVKAFQGRNGLKVDGVCGEDTAQAVYSDNAIDAGSSVTTPPAAAATEAPTRILKKGDSGADVISVQNRLKALGYYTMTVDGQYGSGTVAAVKYFQARNALKVDGKVGPNTVAVLYSDKAVAADSGSTGTQAPTATPQTTPSRTLRYGDKGDDVVLLQVRLMALGYLSGKADGVFGSATGAAVAQFQLINGLDADGVAGPKTYKKLFSDSAIPANQGSQDSSSTAVPTRDLTIGSTGDDVKYVQTRLKALGYLSGSVDGIYGSNTALAMQAFQTKNGLTATGTGNSATYAVLFSMDAITADGIQADDSTSTNYSTLTIGSTGNEVIRLQQMLSTLKYTVNINGTYDEATYAAVLAFQKRNGLTPDGIAGKNTQTKLYSGNCVTGDTVLPGESDSTGSTGNGGGPNVSDVQWLMWYDEVKPNLKSRQVILVYEPSSKTSYYVWVYARGRHLDCEPYTAEDAAKLKAAWGGYSWSEKPVYVRLPNGTWCIASTFSMPHEENPIKDNNFDGHVCIHFPRTMEETIAAGDTKNGVRHQNDIRKHWLAITGENITW